MELEQYVLNNYINRLLKIQNNKKVILEKDLKELKFGVAEMVFIRELLSKNNISIIEKQIQNNNRSKLVRDYNYGEISGLSNEMFDKPVMANLEYDNDGNIIYENWERLEKFLEDDFIPENIRMKRKWDQETKETFVFPSIQLSSILKLRFSEMEVKHIIEFLNKDGIHVSGRNSTLDEGFENYDYINTYRGNRLPDVISPELTVAKFYRYLETKSKELRDELVVENMRLALYLSYKMSVTTGIDMNELQSYAYEGLIKAVDGFDPNAGYKFSTYAYSVIKGCILIGIPEILGFKKGKIYNYFLLIKKVAEEQFDTTLEKSPEIVDDIVEFLVSTGKIDASNSREIKTRILLHVQENLDDYMDNREVSPDYSDDYICNDYDSECLSQDNLLYLEINNIFAHEQIKEILSTLNEREQIILNERFWSEEGTVRKLTDIGKMFGIKPERVHQIEGRALCKLRHPSRVKFLTDYLDEYNQYNYEPNMMKINSTKIKKRT